MESGLTVKWHDRLHPSQKHFDYMKELGVQDGLVSPSMSSFTSDVLKVCKIFFLFISMLLLTINCWYAGLPMKKITLVLFAYNFVMRIVGIENIPCLANFPFQ